MIRNYRIIIFSLLTIITFSSFAQEKSGFSYDIYGFFNAQYYFNTRKTYSSVDGLYSLYPLAPNYNSKGEDLNGINNHYFTVSTTRIGTKFNFGEINGTKFRGLIEADFTGQAGGLANYFRFRHAYLQINWKKSQMIIGQYWNPMTIHQVSPFNKEIHNGAPFRPFSRIYQVRYEYKPFGKFNILSALSFQRDNATIGVDKIKDYNQQVRTFIPIMNLHFQYSSDNLFAGIGGEFKAIQPRETYTINNQTLIMNEKMYNFSTSVYFKYLTKKHSFKSQAIIGDNLNDMSIIGGYYESAFDTINNKFSYNPTTTFSSWLDYSYDMGNFKPAVLIGYTKDLDVNTKGYQNAYGLGMDIDNYFRISPRIDYELKNNFFLTFCVEYQNVKFKDISKRVEALKFSLNCTYTF